MPFCVAEGLGQLFYFLVWFAGVLWVWVLGVIWVCFCCGLGSVLDGALQFVKGVVGKGRVLWGADGVG